MNAVDRDTALIRRTVGRHDASSGSNLDRNRRKCTSSSVASTTSTTRCTSSADSPLLYGSQVPPRTPLSSYKHRGVSIANGAISRWERRPRRAARWELRSPELAVPFARLAVGTVLRAYQARARHASRSRRPRRCERGHARARRGSCAPRLVRATSPARTTAALASCSRICMAFSPSMHRAHVSSTASGATLSTFYVASFVTTAES